MPRETRAPIQDEPSGRQAGRTALAALFACAVLGWTPVAMAGPGKRPADGPHASAPGTAARTSPAPHPVSVGSEVALRALALVGVPYRWGGTRPATGLDCSGLVHHVYGEVGLATPRDTRGLARSGSKVSRSSLQPGDLVFFNTLRRAYSHVGIYLGNGRFVHAPSAGSEVRVESMSSPYWRARYNGARRLAPTDAETPATMTASRPGDDATGAQVADSASRADAGPDRSGSLALGEEVASFYRY